MIDERDSKSSKNRNISPMIRAFMHVALLRRLGVAQTEAERQQYIDEFLAIREEKPAREYVAKVRAEAKAHDQLERRRRGQKPKPTRY